MSVAYSLTPELRMKLKHPLGILIRGSFAKTMNRLKKIVEEEKPPCIVAVGDTVSKNLVKSSIIPNLTVIDNIAMRKATQPISLATEKSVDVMNPAGTITDEAVKAIQDSLKAGKRTKIVVDGEEDLLTLIAVVHAPEDSLVVYGQPYQGIVVVKATTAKKAEVAAILKAMEDGRKAK
jgi:uncharacterized protein (UPF0218 family)